MPEVKEQPSEQPGWKDLRCTTFDADLLFPRMTGRPAGTINHIDPNSTPLDILDKGYEPLEVLKAFVLSGSKDEEFIGAKAMRAHVYDRLNGEELPRYTAYIKHIFSFTPMYNRLRTEVLQALVLHELRYLPDHCKFFDANKGTRYAAGLNPKNILDIAFRAAYLDAYRHHFNPEYAKFALSIKKAIDRLDWDTIEESRKRGSCSAGYNEQWAEIAYKNLNSHPEAASEMLEVNTAACLQPLGGKPVTTGRQDNIFIFPSWSRYETGQPVIELVKAFRDCFVQPKTIAAILELGLERCRSSSKPDELRIYGNFLDHLPEAIKDPQTYQALRLLPEELLSRKKSG